MAILYHASEYLQREYLYPQGFFLSFFFGHCFFAANTKQVFIYNAHVTCTGFQLNVQCAGSQLLVAMYLFFQQFILNLLVTL